MTNYNVAIAEPILVFFDSTFFDTAFFDDGAQTLVITDSLAAQSSHFANISETTTISDSLTRVLGALRSVAEGAVSISESLVAQVLHIVIIYEPFKSFFDGIYFDTAFFDNSAPTYQITDSLAASANHFSSISEASIAISDALARVYNAVRSIGNEIVNVAEGLVANGGYFRAISDPQGFFDSIFFDTAFFDTAIQPIAITDQVLRSYAANISISEAALSISDLLSKGAQAVRSIVEAANSISEQLARAVNVKGIITESGISTSDSIVSTIFKFAFLRIRKTSAAIAKRITNAFVAKRSTSGAVK